MRVWKLVFQPKSLKGLCSLPRQFLAVAAELETLLIAISNCLDIFQYYPITDVETQP